MPLEYSSTDSLSADAFIKLCVYGPSGIGKTVLFRTMPGRKILIGGERGELSLAQANQLRIFGSYEQIPIIRISSGADLQEAYNVVSGPHGKDFESVGLDSLSEIAERVLASEMVLNKDPRKAYGNMQDIMAKYIRLFRDLPSKHVLMTAKQDRESDSNGAVLFQPSMPGKTMTREVPYFFDEVFALVMTPGEQPGQPSRRMLRTRSDHQFSAKDRSGALAELEQPDLGQIIAKIKTTQ